MQKKHKHLLLLYLLLPLWFFGQAVYAENTDSEPASEATTEASTEAEVKISDEAIASLSGLLSEEQFNLVKDKLIGQAFTGLDLSVLRPELAAEQDEEQETEQLLVFSDQDLDKVRQSLSLYFDTLSKIKQIAPFLKVIYEQREEIKKREGSLGNLMKEELVSAQKEIDEHKTKLQSYTESFKKVAYEFNLKDINLEKLPGMLGDLGYDSDFYDIAYTELSNYLGLIKKVNTATSILDSLSELTASIEAMQAQLVATETEEEKAAITEKLKKLVENKKALHTNFTLTATGIDSSTLEEKNSKKINVEEELNKIFSPLVIGLTEFTEPSRRIEFLRSNIAYYQQNLPKIRDGLVQIEMLLSETRNAEVKAKLLEEQEYWQTQEKEFTAKLEVAEQQLIDLQNRKLSPLDAFEQFIEAVFSKRGLNIMFAIMMFFVSIIVLLLLRRLITLINPFSYIPKLRFISSLIDVSMYLLTFVIATLTLMVSLYMAGEVLALAIVVIILLGLVWAVREALPKFLGQIKLLLGYGPVRQGERVIYEGIAYLVDSIGIYSYLKNPLLTGGTIRLPIKDLLEMHSRPYDEEKETWFPCKEGDAIIMRDTGAWRIVSIQTPQRITLDWYGAPETLPTSTFLGKQILNLSKGPFWSGITLYIDYQHRHETLGEINDKLTAFVDEQFKALPFFGENLIATWITFGEMNDTSLGYWVWAQMKPEAGLKYSAINLNLTQICLAAANKYGWEIKRFHALNHQIPQGLMPASQEPNN